MKKIMIGILLLMGSLAQRSKAQSIAELVVQLGINIDQLGQLKGIYSNMKQGYEVVSGGYRKVKDLSEGNFKVHQVFLDGLMQVSPVVRKYRKIPEIISYQATLIKEYKSAIKKFKGRGNFSVKELEYLEAVYKNLFNQSLENLDELIAVTTAGKLRMSDDERLEAINRLHTDMQEKLVFLPSFNNDAGLISLARAQQQFELKSAAKLHGINVR